MGLLNRILGDVLRSTPPNIIIIDSTLYSQASTVVSRTLTPANSQQKHNLQNAVSCLEDSNLIVVEQDLAQPERHTRSTTLRIGLVVR